MKSIPRNQSPLLRGIRYAPPAKARSPVEGLQAAARWLVGAVLIFAGFSKLVGPLAEFAATIAAYRLPFLPSAWITPVSLVLPWVELLTGVYLFFGYFTRLAASISIALFSLFIIVLGSAIGRGIDLASCGCFGAGFTLSPKHTIGFDAVFLLLALLAVTAKPPAFFSLDAWIHKTH